MKKTEEKKPAFRVGRSGSMKEIALFIESSQTNVTRLRRGMRTPSKNMCYKLKAAFKVLYNMDLPAWSFMFPELYATKTGKTNPFFNKRKEN